MKKMLLASTSTIFGQKYLEYLHNEIKNIFLGCKNILFIPYARPSGISHLEYTIKVKTVFNMLGLNIIDYTNENIRSNLEKCDGIFTGGGNTFLLLSKLYEFNLIDILKNKINLGTPYLGTSAGSNICGLSIGTTNDMPIIEVESFKALGVLNFNINPHYIDKVGGIEHMGESRETRINEFHKFNDQFVIGLREGSYLQVQGSNIYLKGLNMLLFSKKRMRNLRLKMGLILKI